MSWNEVMRYKKFYDCNYDISYLLLSSDFQKEQGPQKKSEQSNQIENLLKLDHSEPDAVKKNTSVTKIGTHIGLSKKFLHREVTIINTLF